MKMLLAGTQAFSDVTGFGLWCSSICLWLQGKTYAVLKYPLLIL